ncbi:MAG TPA: hypothetical protein PLS81_01555, partial [Deltaproteobacteria bacterium]|nr:hypothetical protein [Deltaproteobacteria bacterium]
MIDDLLYRCPLCGAFDWLDKDRCVSCSATFRLTGRSAAEMNGERAPLSYWYDRTRGFDLACGPDGTIAKSRRVTLSREAASGMYHGFAGITAYHFTRARIDEGTLTLTPSSLTFAGLAARMTIPMEGILSLTIESNTLIVVGAGHGALFFDFHEESGKKWEDLLRKTLERHYEGDEIVEFYPRVRLRSGITRTPRTEAPARELRAPARRWYRKDTSLLETILKPLGKFLVR